MGDLTYRTVRWGRGLRGSLQDTHAKNVRMRVVFARRQSFPYAAVYNDLTNTLTARLQQDRIHRWLRLEPTGLGLCDLCAANLTTAGARIRVI